MAYVHPLSKSKSSSFLSLEMCTESLGSENGSINEDFPPLERQRISEEALLKQPQRRLEKKSSSFPPPLTSISGLRTHREGGRLVIEASAFSSRGRCFVAERGNGRLRLSLSLTKDEDGDEDEDEEEEEEEEEEEDGLCGHGHDYMGEKCLIGRCNGGDRALPFCVAIPIS